MKVNLKKIKDLCYKRHITLKQLAQKTGISQTALTMAMHRNSTTLETFKKLSEFFCVPMEFFYQEGSAEYYDSLSFYCSVRSQLIQQIWNCPPNLNEPLDFHITNLYEVQMKITELINQKNTEENEKTTE